MTFVTEGETFTPVELLESDYEAMFLRLVESLLPGWIGWKWKQRLFGASGAGVEPDVVMFSQTDQDWAVVEVELAGHSISNHIAPQLRRLHDAQYGRHLSSSLVKATGRPLAEVEARLAAPPVLLCVADAWTERLAETCREYEFQLVVAEPFRSEAGRPALRRVIVPPSLQRERGQHEHMERVVLNWSGRMLAGRPICLVVGRPTLQSVIEIRDRERAVVCRRVKLGDGTFVVGQLDVSWFRDGGQAVLVQVDDEGVYEIQEEV